MANEKMIKVAFFYTAWTDSGERFLQASAQEKISLVPIHYSQLGMEAKVGEWEITFEGRPLSEFDLFYFRNVGDQNEALPLLLEYSQKHHIPIVDDYLLKVGGAFRKKKSCEAMMLLGDGVSYPKSFFTADRELLKRVVSEWEKPLIVKSTGGRHGTSTFLIKEMADLERILFGRSAVDFLVQEYIPNDGDYRLFLIGYEVVAGFKREEKEDKLILNRSVGTSKSLAEIPKLIADEAKKAAKILGVEITGIDCVIDKMTGNPVIIEVNQAPEFYVMEKRTGVDIAGKIISYLRSKCQK